MTSREGSDASGARSAEVSGDQGGGLGRRWLGVEFRHLGALAAVAQEGSFRRAARSLGYVQSAISGQIAQLERAVGTQLVERSSGSAGATLTPAGEVLLGHVDEILARFEAARIDIGALADVAAESMRIGVLDGVGKHRLSEMVESFGRRFPNARVVLDESHEDEENFERLAGGEIDLMITELPLPPGPFDYLLLDRDEYVLLVASGSPLAGRLEPPSVAQLSRLPLILPAAARSQDIIAVRLRENLIDQPPSLRPRSAAIAQALVAAGLGSAVVPRLAIDPDDDATVTVSLGSLLPPRSIALAMHREREYSAAVKGFIEIAQTLVTPPAKRA